MALAPPVEKDGFSYAGDAFYCETRNLNRHRRATVPELKAHFNGKNSEDRPAHWYEAQLRHYGLPPTTVKGTAHKRLFDAVRIGSLTVPASIAKIETDLKKEWNKRDREVKKMLRESAAAKVKPATQGTKRKADQTSTYVNVNVTVQIPGVGATAKQPAAKKARTTGPKASTGASASSATKARGTAAPKASATPKAKAKPKATTPATPRAGPSATGRPGLSRDAFGGSPSGYDMPPPYSEFDPNSGGRAVPMPQSSQSPSKGRIGLLNGRYRVSCPYIEGNFPDDEGQLEIIATLDGNTLWLTFDFGEIGHGIIKTQRPYEPEPENGQIMLWRGHVLPQGRYQRQYFNTDDLNQWARGSVLWFFGDGHIGGLMSYGEEVEFDFDAYRVPGQSMTSEISPTEARRRWAET